MWTALRVSLSPASRAGHPGAARLPPACIPAPPSRAGARRPAVDRRFAFSPRRAASPAPVSAAPEGEGLMQGGQGHLSRDRKEKFRYADEILRTRVTEGDGGERVEPAAAGSLVDWALAVLRAADPRDKCALTHRAMAAWSSGAIPLGSLPPGCLPPDRPARPPAPAMVPFHEVPPQKASGLGNAEYVLHQLAHVELNAIDLAWDTVARFAHEANDGEGGGRLPVAFFEDFAWVADDEARHLGWCLARMDELGSGYGAMVAHDNLWDCAKVTFEDLEARLAVVPMVQEARGLDAGPRLAGRLVGWGDNRSAEIVRQISVEEIEHVAVGVRWFRHLCEQTGDDPGERFKDKVQQHCAFLMRGPYNHESREIAGLEREWYESITADPASKPRLPKGDYSTLVHKIK